MSSVLDLIDPNVLAAGNAPLPEESQFSRGLRSTSLGMGSQLNTLAGEIGTRVGANDFARGRFSAAEDLSARAAEAAPRITDFRQVNGLRDAADYGAGLAGGAVPVVGAGLAAAVLTRGRAVPTLLANTGLMTGFETGDVLQRQAAAGQPTDLGTAALAGTGSAALQSLVPAAAGARMFTGGTAARVGKAAGMQGLGGAGGEAMKQAGAEQPFDLGQVANAGIGSAVVGAPFGVLPGPAGTSPQKAPGAPNATPGATGVLPGPEKSPSGPPTGSDNASEAVYTGLKGLSERVQGAARGAVDRVSQGLPASLEGLGDLKDAALLDRVKALDADTVAQVKGWGDSMLSDAGLTPERREKLTAAMGDLGQEANRVTVATMKKAADASRQGREAIDRLHAHLSKQAEGTDWDGLMSNTGKVARMLGDTALEHLQAAPAKARLMADKMAGQLRESNLPPEVKTQIEAALKNPGDAGNRAYLAASKFVAEQYKGTDWGGIGDNVKQLSKALVRTGAEKGEIAVDKLQAALDGLRAKRGVKKSEDYEGFEAKLREAVKPALAKIDPDIADDAGALNKVAAALRMYGEQVAKREPGSMDSDTIAMLMDAFPDNLNEVLGAVQNTVLGDDRANVERWFGGLNQIDAASKSDKQTFDKMRESLKPALQDQFTMRELREMHKHLKSWMGRAPDRGERSVFFDNQVNQFINDHFDKPDELRTLLEKEAKDTSLVIEREQAPKKDSDDRLDSDLEFDDKLSEGGAKTTQVSDELVDSPAAHRAQWGNEGAAERMIRQAKEKDPNSEATSYRWMRASEYNSLMGLGVDPTLDKNKGYVVAQRMDGTDKWTESDFNRFKFDTKKGDRRTDPSAVNAGTKDVPIWVDAMKLAHGGKSADESVKVGDTTSLGRMARRFMNNVAAMTEYLGRTPRISESTVVAKWSDGKKITAGELKRLHGSDRKSPGEMIPKLEAALEVARNSRDKVLQEALGKRLDALRFAQDAELSADDAPVTYFDLQKQLATAEANNDSVRVGEIERRMAKMRLDDEVADSNMRKDADPDAQIHEAAARAGSFDAPLNANERGGMKADSNPKIDTGISRTFNEDGTPIIDPKRNSSPVELMARRSNLDAGREPASKKALPEGKATTIAQRRAAREAAEAKAREAVDDDPQTSLDGSAEQVSRSEMDDHATWERQVAWVERTFSKSLADAKAAVDKLNQTQIDALANHIEDTPGLPNGVKPNAYIQLRSYVLDRSYNQEAPPDPKALAAKKAAFLERARSGEQALIKELRASDDPKGLQRAVESLKGEEGVDAVVDALNARLGELVQDPDVAYGLQTGKYSLSQQPATGANSTVQERARVERYIDKVLGKTVRTAWAAISHAGDFERLQTGDVVRISVHALNPMSTAFHEAFHGFVAKLGDSRNDSVKNVMLRAADSPTVRRQLERLLANAPAALRQLADPEERAAYMYQFWQTRDAQGNRLLNVGPETNGVFTKLAGFFRKMLGLWSNDDRALHIMEHFSRGDYAKIMGDTAAIDAAYMKVGRNAALDYAAKLTKPLANMGETLASAGSARLRDSGVPALRELADIVKATNRDTDTDPGFIPAARIERTRVMNKLGELMHGYEKGHIDEALKALQSGANATGREARAVQLTIKKTLRDLKDYMGQAGVLVSDLGPNYFPRVYSPDYISRHQTEFVALLESYGVADPHRVMNKIIGADGNEFQIETNRPGMQHLKLRKLAMIPDAELEPFMSKDTFHILNSYVTQATRRAEWARRLGDDGAKLKELLIRAKQEGADNELLDYTHDYVMGVDGTLGDTLNPTARRLMGDMIVYQNIRLLPLAIFSSVVDPVGIMVRGGTVNEAWTTFKRGVSEARKNFQKDPKRDAATELAEMLGVIDNAALVHSLGALYSQGMVGDTGRKINDTFFRYNLMEQFNASMRVGATEAAINFIGRHSSGTTGPHSARWLAELGLNPNDVQLDASGRPKLTEAQGLTAEHATRMRTAVNRWVDGAVLRPDAADKPVWMNDPKFALLSHLKQFVYSFHETILKRIAHEAEYGNYKPMMAMTSYVPIMIASDMVKGLIQGGGSQPEWKDDWGLDDYLWSGVQRAGLLGVGQFAIDAGTRPLSLAGPTLEQLTDAVSVLGGRDQFNHFAIRSMPANAVYASAFDGASTPDPIHSE